MDITAKLRSILEKARLLPLKDQAELSTEILLERLETVVPLAMKEADVDLWLVMGKENCEDPIQRTMITWDMMRAARISILVFHYDKTTGEVRRYSCRRQSPLMDSIYNNIWQRGEEPFEVLARLIEKLDPEKIAVNTSDTFGYCDGFTITNNNNLIAALPDRYKTRIVSAEKVGVRYLQTQSPLEQETHKALVEVTQEVIRYCFSSNFVVPGRTTTTDIEWKMRELFVSADLDYWFGPDVDLQKASDMSGARLENALVEEGDLLHVDIGCVPKYVHLFTDLQWLSYVCKAGESEAPLGIRNLLAVGNRFRDIVTGNFANGRTGNEIFKLSIDQAHAEGISAMLYSHPVGTYGHGAGPLIGLYDSQGYVKGAGEWPVVDNTAYALELNINAPVPEWNNRNTWCYLEEDIFFDGKDIRYIADRQTEMLLI